MQDMFVFGNFLGKSDPSSYVKDKDLSIKTYMKYIFIRLQKMFKYNNLPDSIPREVLEYYLLCNGTCFVTEVDSRLVVLIGSAGNVLDEYYRPTRYIVTNPYLKLSKDYNIREDGVLMRNDSMWLGLYPLISRYSTILAENTITIRVADIMLRVMALLTAPDDKSKIAADAYLAKLENGDLAAIAENRFLDGINMQSPPSNNGSYLTQFIELQQYMTGSFYNEIGLNANYNMKREAIGDGESSLNEDSLAPLCEEMLRCRQEDVKKINNMFGTDISVEFDSSWASNVLENELALEQMKSKASQLANNEEVSESTEEIEEVSESNEEEEASQLAEETQDEETEEVSEEKGDDDSDSDTSDSSDKEHDTDK